jgi:acid phosphatase (class A)
MKSRFLISAVGAGVVLLAAAALAQSPAAPALKGYLSTGEAPDTLRILPPPPKAGSAREAADVAVFKATRALAGTPRWSLATGDADLSQGPAFFSCAIGLKLDPASAPALSTVFRKVAYDTRPVVDPPKNHFARPRPYTAPDALTAPVCVEKSEGLTKNPSYPSGHSSLSWTWGLIMAELAPDRATEVLARARSIGESRVVCGVHYVSDVEAGRVTGASLVAALHANAAFRVEMDRAHAELAALRAAPHAAPSDCAVQNEAAAHSPY